MSYTGTVKNRIICCLLTLAMLITFTVSLTGCGADQGPQTVENAGQVISETDTDITIVDQAGREVTVSRDIDSIALCWRVVIRFLLNLDQGDKITGMGKSEPFLEEMQPSLKDCADVGKGVADIEALAELEPDLFIHKSSDVETLDAVQEIGIPSIGINVETPEDMIVAVDILGKVCGAEDKADELISFYNKEIGHCEEISAGIADDKKCTAVVMGTSIGKVADGTMLQGRMLDLAGAVNCADGMKATELWPTAGTEQIFSWDPDYIFITGSESAVYTPEDIYNEDAWSELKAVKNRHVYLMPSEADSWEFPGIVSVLGVEYMMNTMYPDLMTDEVLESKVSEFYALAYGRTMERDELGY